MTWELYALVAAASFGVQAVILRWLMPKADTVIFMWLFNLLIAAVSAPLLLIDSHLPQGLYPWMLLIGAALLWCLEGFLVFESFRHTEVSLREPLSKLSVLFVFILSVVFLNESATLQKILGTAAVFAGVAVLAYEKKRFFGKISMKGVRLTLVASLVTAFVILADKAAMNYFHPIPYSVLITLLAGLVFTPFAWKRKRHVRALMRQKSKLAAVVVLGIVAYLAALTAYTLTEVSNVIPVMELSAIIAIAGGFFFHREQETGRRLLGALFIILGVILIVQPNLIVKSMVLFT